MKKEIIRVLEIIKDTNFDSKKETKKAIANIIAIMDTNPNLYRDLEYEEYDMCMSYRDSRENALEIFGTINTSSIKEEVIENFSSFQFNSRAGKEAIEEMEKFIEQNSEVFINLTPHTITLMNEKFEVIEVLESKGIVRAEEKKEIIKEINGVKIYKTSFKNINGLPEKQKNVIYIVSRIILDACKDRDDLVTTSQIVRKDTEGNLSNHPFAKGDIVGCQALSL